jgi:dTDP-4-amino-4,6-dideoxygalactose transaminase
MITTNDYNLYKCLLRLRSHGINKLDDEFQNPILSRTANLVNPWYYEMIELGFNYRMTEIQAVLGTSQLKRLDKFMSRRLNRVKKYVTSFQAFKDLRPAQSCEFTNSANHIFPVRIDFATLGISRAELMASLRLKGVGTQVHYIPIPIQPYYQSLGYELNEIPEALSYYEEALTLPLFPDLRRSEQKRVIAELSRLLHDR